MSPASPDPYLVTALNQTAQKLPFKKNIFKKLWVAVRLLAQREGSTFAPSAPWFLGLVAAASSQATDPALTMNLLHFALTQPASSMVCGDTVPSGRLGASAFRKYCLSPRICPAPHHHLGIEARAGSQPSITCLCWRRRTGWHRDCQGVGWGWGDGALVQEAASIY